MLPSFCILLAGWPTFLYIEMGLISKQNLRSTVSSIMLLYKFELRLIATVLMSSY